MVHSPSAVIAMGLLSFSLTGGEADKPQPVRTGTPPLRIIAAITSADDVRAKGAPATGQTDSLPLRKPNAVAVDKAGRIFVADPGHRGILIFDRQAQTAVRWTGTDQYPLFGPAAIALDDSGRVFVTDVYKSQVVVFREGAPIAAFGRDVLKRPEAIAIDARRARVYVGDMRLNQVISFDLNTFAAGPVIDRQLAGPSNIAVNQGGEIYVSEQADCRIQVLSADGKLVRAMTLDCKKPAAHPIAMGRDGRVYVAGAAADSGIVVFDPSGKITRVMTPRSAAKQFVPTGIAVDESDRIYVCEQGPDQGRVQVFEATRIKAVPTNAPAKQ